MTTTTALPETDTPLRLMDQVRGKIRIKHYSIRTEDAYADWIKRFIRHFGKRLVSELPAG